MAPDGVVLMKVERNRSGEWCIVHERRWPYSTVGRLVRYEKLPVSPYAGYAEALEVARRVKEQEER